MTSPLKPVTRPMWFVYVALAALLLYVALVGIVALGQTRMLFPTQLTAAAAPRLPSDAKRLSVRTPDGVDLVGVRMAGRSDAGRSTPLLIGFGGNAWNADSMALYLHGLLPQAEIVTFHYRGYPPSTGSPSAQALQDDALVLFDRLGLADRREVVAVGFSIGSGVAAFLAAHRPVAGLILVTPFDSLKALAQDHFPWAPVGLLLNHHMPVLDLIRGQTTPVALIAAERDTIVPPGRTEPLRSAVPNLVFDRIVAGAGHNDLYDRPAFADAFREAVARIAHQAKPSGDP